MTNLEWLLSLPVNDIEKRYHSEECTLCIYDNSGECDNRSCVEGKLKWLSKERDPEAELCPVCKGKMGIKYRNGYYLVCHGCGLHFGIAAKEAEGGTIEGGYPTEETLIDTWNSMMEQES